MVFRHMHSLHFITQTLHKNLLVNFWYDGSIFWKKLCYKQKVMLTALICKKFKILRFLITIDTTVFNNIPFNMITLCSDTKESWYLINEFSPYKYKCSFSEISFDDIEAIRIIHNSWENYVEDSGPLVLYYGKHVRESITSASYIKPRNSKYFKMKISFCTKEEIMDLKWDDRMDLMLLGYGVQNNSFKSLPDDLIKNIIIYL